MHQDLPLKILWKKSIVSHVTTVAASQSANLIITQQHTLVENTRWKSVNTKRAKDTDKSFSLLKDILENVLESAIVSLQDGVLSAHVERPFFLDGVLEAAVSEASDGLLERDERQNVTQVFHFHNGEFS